LSNKVLIVGFSGLFFFTFLMFSSFWKAFSFFEIGFKYSLIKTALLKALKLLLAAQYF
jgi:hypothetical protein